MDVSNIEPGDDFVDIIEDAVSSCDVLVALIGRQWLDISDKNGRRRLENPNDFVRLEISTALKRKIRVIPVLLHGASMPHAADLPGDLVPLSRRNALEVSHASFNIDVGKLQKAIKKYLDISQARRDLNSKTPSPKSGNNGPNLLVNLVPSPNPVTKNGDVNWTATVINQEDIPFRNLTVLHGRKLLLDNLNLTPGETQWISFEKKYAQTGEHTESIQILGQDISLEAKNIVQVEKPPQLSISLTARHSEIEADENVKWVVEVHNLGGGDLQRLMIIHGQELLEDPVDLPVGKCFQTTFIKSYSEKGNVTEDVTISAMTKSGEVLQKKQNAVIYIKSDSSKDYASSTSQTQELIMLQKRYPITINSPIQIELIRIPKGEFYMGSDGEYDESSIDREHPLHRVFLPEFSIGKNLITNNQYNIFLKASSYQKPPGWDEKLLHVEKENYPVINISWYDAMAFCEWMSAKTGKKFTLPSEAEWEKAARGIDGRIYPWGNTWNDSFCNTNISQIQNTTPIGKYSPKGDSPFGCTDMAGNVWEWTRSLWGDHPIDPQYKYPYDPMDGRENTEAPNNILRVVRGGAWCHEPQRARCAYRGRYFPEIKLDRRGFRVVIQDI
jgi:formylglycine-generating enzyme required for sulfatase activity